MSVECNQPKNEHNATLDQAAVLARRVRRLAPGALPAPSAGPGGTLTPAPATPTTPARTRIQINTSTAGDNTIVAGSPGQVIEIWELLLYNVAVQTLNLKDSEDTLPLQGPLTTFPATTGYFLPVQGEPHFELKPGGSFLLNLGAATQVTGFVRYSLRAE